LQRVQATFDAASYIFISAPIVPGL